MWTLLLERLDVYAGLRATRAEWATRLGDPMPNIIADYLVITDEEALGMPCRQHPSCGVAHEVRSLSEGRLIAVSTDHESRCSSFVVQPADLAVYQFDLDRLASDIAEALTIEVAITCVRSRPTLQRIGIAPHADWPVFIGLPRRPADCTRLVETTTHESASHDPSVLLLPSAERLDADTRRIAAANRVKLGFLDEILTFDDRTGWRAEQELEDLFPASGRVSLKPKRLRLPPGTGWSDIVVTLMRNDRVSISHRSGNPNLFYTPAELDFETASGRRTKAWESFEEAVNLGCVQIATTVGKRDENARNRVRAITEALQRAVSIEALAFQDSERPLNGSPQHTRLRGYWPLFKLRYEQERFARPLGNYPDAQADFRDEHSE